MKNTFLERLKNAWFMLTTPLRYQHWCLTCENMIHSRDWNDHKHRGHKVMSHNEEYFMYYEQEMRGRL